MLLTQPTPNSFISSPDSEKRSLWNIVDVKASCGKNNWTFQCSLVDPALHCSPLPLSYLLLRVLPSLFVTATRKGSFHPILSTSLNLTFLFIFIRQSRKLDNVLQRSKVTQEIKAKETGLCVKCLSRMHENLDLKTQKPHKSHTVAHT